MNDTFYQKLSASKGLNFDDLTMNKEASAEDVRLSLEMAKEQACLPEELVVKLAGMALNGNKQAAEEIVEGMQKTNPDGTTDTTIEDTVVENDPVADAAGGAVTDGDVKDSLVDSAQAAVADAAQSLEALKTVQNEETEQAANALASVAGSAQAGIPPLETNASKASAGQEKLAEDDKKKKDEDDDDDDDDDDDENDEEKMAALAQYTLEKVAAFPGLYPTQYEREFAAEHLASFAHGLSKLSSYSGEQVVNTVISQMGPS